MAKRAKYIHSQVTEDTYEGIRDAANFQGCSLSVTIDNLVQRGLISLDKELGSNTPLHVQIARLHGELTSHLTTRERIQESLKLATELGDTVRQQKVEQLSEKLKLSQE